MLISKSIIINASPREVKEVFMDFPNHSKWNPLFTKIEICDPAVVNPVPGTKLKVELDLKGDGNPTVMSPLVSQNSESTFAWKGTLGWDWLFSGGHKFEFRSIDDNGTVKTELIQSETFSGIISSAILWFVREDTEKGFAKLNNALKEKVESR